MHSQSIRTLKGSRIKAFLTLLQESYTLYDVRDDPFSPKRYLIPPIETTFTHNKATGKTAVPKGPGPFVLFGLSLRELEALTYLDEIMRTPEEDFYYSRRREKAVLVGITEESFEAAPGGDLLLRKVEDDLYEPLALTPKGRKILKSASRLLTSTVTPSAKKRNKKNPTMKRLRKLLKDPELLKDAVEWSWKGAPSIWKRLENECMGCGICTYVCPLCHCFSTEESLNLTGDCSSRCRTWTACTLPDFSAVAGGHKFHNSIKTRYYNWYFHKFVRAYLEFGKSQCTACGRCQKECPARIDIEKVLIEIVKAYGTKK
ncbi:MAG: 4Fe-4S dicluster domain-containing protein [Thermodesulfobacteriota bacterium]